MSQKRKQSEGVVLLRQLGEDYRGDWTSFNGSTFAAECEDIKEDLNTNDARVALSKVIDLYRDLGRHDVDGRCIQSLLNLVCLVELGDLTLAEFSEEME